MSKKKLAIGDIYFVHGEKSKITSIMNTQRGWRIMMKPIIEKKKRKHPRPQMGDYYLHKSSDLREIIVRYILFSGTKNISYVEFIKTRTESNSNESMASPEEWNTWRNDAEKISKTEYKSLFGLSNVLQFDPLEF